MAYYPVHRPRMTTAERRSLLAAAARLPHVIRYIAPHRGGGMARRITIVSDENLTYEEYAGRGNRIRAALKIAHPDGGFRLESDGVTTVPCLNDRRAGHGRQCPWQ